MPTRPYHTKDGKRVPGVTTVLHSWLPGGPDALMGWAVKEENSAELLNACKQFMDAYERAVNADD